MAKERGSGGRKGRVTGPRGSGSSTKKKSGWVKPDGTPLRKRKGDYFPDQEIDKRKPAQRSKSAFPRPSKSYDSPGEVKPEKGFDRAYKKEDGGFSERRYKDSDSAERAPRPVRPDRDDRPARTERDSKSPGFRSGSGGLRGDNRAERPEKKSTYSDYKSRSGASKWDDRPQRSRNDDPKTERSSSGERPVDDAATSRVRKDDTRPAFKKKPFEKKRERYADRDHSKVMKGRFDRKPGNRDFKKRESYKSKLSASSEPGVLLGAVRLNKFIANAGICSRREADDLITAGVISINGNVITELGTKVMPGDEVKFNDQTLRTEKMVYVLLNKPKDYITTTDDPDERKTVMNLVHDAAKERIFPVGRLDRNTTGLLLLTNDGELTKRLTHPSGNIKKIYQVELDRNLSQADMIRAAEGVELEDGSASVDEIHYESPNEKNIVGVELHSGRNRVVRRIFEALDYKVRKLDRVYFAGLTKKDLPRGRWRFLTEMEVNMLKMLTGKKKG